MGKTLTVLPVSRPSQLPPPLPREAGDISPARVCRMVFDELCVLANGDVVCSCGDPAGKRVYGNVYRDRLTDLYNGPLYREIPTLAAGLSPRLVLPGRRHPLWWSGFRGEWIGRRDWTSGPDAPA